MENADLAIDIERFMATTELNHSDTIIDLLGALYADNDEE